MANVSNFEKAMEQNRGYSATVVAANIKSLIVIFQKKFWQRMQLEYFYNNYYCSNVKGRCRYCGPDVVSTITEQSFVVKK